MKKHSIQTKRAKRGVGKLWGITGSGMLEAAITVPVFLMVVLMVVDITRYFVARNVLNYAAFSAADMASKLELETDTTTKNCKDDNSPDNPCAKYCRRVKAILKRADDIASAMVSKAPGIGSLRRLPLQHYSDNTQSIALKQANITDCDLSALNSYGVGLIRPGEEVLTVEPNQGQAKVINHPTRPFGSGTNEGWPNEQRGETWDSTLSIQPFQIVMDADFKPVMPLIGTIRMSIRFTAYRRTGAYGHGARPPSTATPQSIAPGATPIPTPTPTAEPVCPPCCNIGAGVPNCAYPQILECTNTYCLGTGS